MGTQRKGAAGPVPTCASSPPGPSQCPAPMIFLSRVNQGSAKMGLDSSMEQWGAVGCCGVQAQVKPQAVSVHLFSFSSCLSSGEWGSEGTLQVRHESGE